MSDSEKVNLDTSILFNYVFSSLPGDIERDRGSQRIIDSSEYYTAIGGKAESEFKAGCERRLHLYDDAVEYLVSDQGDIYDYDPKTRDIPTSKNDEKHFREGIQMSWYDKSKREQLSALRRCHQDLGQYQSRVPRDLIDRCFPRQTNSSLLSRLQSDLCIGHDCEIVVDAAEICRQHSINTLVAADTDITDPEHIDRINTAIKELLGSSHILNIVEPDDI